MNVLTLSWWTGGQQEMFLNVFLSPLVSQVVLSNFGLRVLFLVDWGTAGNVPERVSVSWSVLGCGEQVWTGLTLPGGLEDSYRCSCMCFCLL